MLGEEIDRALGPDLQELKSQGMGTGLSHSKGELMMEESAGVCLRQRGENFRPDWTPFGVIICG